MTSRSSRGWAPVPAFASTCRGRPTPCTRSPARVPGAACIGRVSLDGTLVAVVDDDPAAIDAMSELFSIWGAQVVGGAMRGRCWMRWVARRAIPISSSRTCGWAMAPAASSPFARCATNLGFAVPALIVSGDTSAAAERAARSAGLTLLPKPVVANVLEAVATALVARAVPRGAAAHAL